MNNLLPFFPTGTQASKFLDSEIVGLLEWAVPEGWRRKFDLKGYIPSSHDKKRFLYECEIIERSKMIARETDMQKEHKNHKKERFNKSANHPKPNGSKGEVSKRYKEDYWKYPKNTKRTISVQSVDRIGPTTLKSVSSYKIKLHVRKAIVDISPTKNHCP